MKRNKRRIEAVQIQVPEIEETIETASKPIEGDTSLTFDGATIPVPKRYSPPNCSVCTELRPRVDANYVSVYHTRRETGYVLHYCKCSFCNNTFCDPERL